MTAIGCTLGEIAAAQDLTASQVSEALEIDRDFASARKR
jgi:hypothetical protein